MEHNNKKFTNNLSPIKKYDHKDHTPKQSNITSKIDQTLKQKKKHDQTYKDHNKKQFNLILKKKPR